MLQLQKGRSRSQTAKTALNFNNQAAPERDDQQKIKLKLRYPFFRENLSSLEKTTLLARHSGTISARPCLDH